MPTNLRTLPMIAAVCAGLTALLNAPVIAQSAAAPQRSQVTLTFPQGDPVRGASIYYVMPMNTRAVQVAGVTDENGSFPIAQNASLVIVVPDRGATAFLPVAQGSTMLAQTPGNGARVSIASPTQITVRLIDERARPIPNAMVIVFPTDDTAKITGLVIGGGVPYLPAPLSERLIGRTDRDGLLILKDLPQRGRISVTVQRKINEPGLVLAGSISLAASPISPTATIRIPFDRTITGRVTYRATGKPVPNAAVYLFGPGYRNGIGKVHAGQDGRYRFTGLPPARYGLEMSDSTVPHAINSKSREFQYCVMGRSSNGEWHNRDSRTDALVKNKIARNIDFDLLEMAVIDGKCVGNGSCPIASTLVMAELPDGSDEKHLTDAHGHFHFRLPPGRIRLKWISAADNASQSGATFILREGDTRTVTLISDAPSASSR